MCVMWNSAEKGQILKKLSRHGAAGTQTLYSSLFLFPVSNPSENIEMRPLNPNTTNQDEDHDVVRNLGETDGGEIAEGQGKKLFTKY